MAVEAGAVLVVEVGCTAFVESSACVDVLVVGIVFEVLFAATV